MDWKFFCQKTKIFLVNFGFCLPTNLWFWQCFFQKEWIGISFLPKNENISGNQRPDGFGNFFLPKKLDWHFLAKNEKFFWQNLGFYLPTTPWLWQSFRQKRVDWHFFFCKKRKLARHQNWQTHEKCDFGQLVLIC